MAISTQFAGAVGTGTTQASPQYFTQPAGDLILLVVGNKYPNNGPSTPAGWTLLHQVSGGAGSAGAGVGSCYCTVFYHIQDGTEGTDPITTVDVPSGNCVVARHAAYRKGNFTTWDLSAVSVAQNTGGSTSWSVTAPSDPGIVAGDWMLAASGINHHNPPQFTSENMTCTGVTFTSHTERIDSSTANNDDVAIVLSEHPVTSGPSSAAPAYTMTALGSGTDYPAGATIFIRLREIPVVSAGIATSSASLSGSGALSGTSAGSATSSATLAGEVAASGTSAGVATSSATLVGEFAVSGTSAGVATESATLWGDGELSGTSTGSVTSSATLAGEVAASGTSDGVATSSATLVGEFAVSGTSTGTSSESATLWGDGELSGTSTGIVISSAALWGDGALDGATSGLATLSGSIGALGELDGAIAGSSTANASIVGAGALAGGSNGVATVTGTSASPRNHANYPVTGPRALPPVTPETPGTQRPRAT